jgi:excinuclease UvrABC nuclease subunit
MVDYVNWDGTSGSTYSFEILEQGNSAANKPGIYIFVKAARNTYTPLYIGEAKDMHDRLTGHEKLPLAEQSGLNQIHLMLAPADQEARRAIESDLITRWAPPLNQSL